MNGDPSNPRHVLFDRLLAEYKPSSKGSSVDSDRIRSIVLDNPDLVAEIFPPLRVAIAQAAGTPRSGTNEKPLTGWPRARRFAATSESLSRLSARAVA